MSIATANFMERKTTMTAAEKVIAILKLTYGLVPIAAGADKFTNLLVNWDQYLSPAITGMLPFSAGTFMILVGIIEIAAGVLVLLRPKTGSIVVCLWLTCIAITLVLSGQYLDVAVRDLVMATGAFSLFTLTRNKEE